MGYVEDNWELTSEDIIEDTHEISHDDDDSDTIENSNDDIGNKKVDKRTKVPNNNINKDKISINKGYQVLDKFLGNMGFKTSTTQKRTRGDGNCAIYSLIDQMNQP